ncbi:MAG: 30S ribosomal protein S1 [Planctomycetota bacterium]|jgi:small subunit ribosomal protein S1
MSSEETQNTEAQAEPAAAQEQVAETAAAPETAAAGSPAEETAAVESQPADEPQSETTPAAEPGAATTAEAETPQPAEASSEDAASDENTATETAGTAAPAEAVALSETPAADESDSAEAQRKVALNPSGDKDARAVGSVVPAADGASGHDIDYAAAAVAAAMTDTVAPTEVEIPKDVDLGDLESEIEAAMQNDAATVTESDPSQQELPSQGARLQGVIQSVHGDDVFVDLGIRIPGVLQVRAFEGTEPPEVGKQIQVVVRKVDENEGLITVNLPSGKQRHGGNWDAIESGQVVDCMVTKTNKGGLEVNVGSIRGFLPAGQIDLGFVDNTEQYVGQKLTVKIIEANQKKRNLVVSRRQLLLDERREAAKDFWESIEEGAEFTGTVKTIKDYGAFVDLGGADGFLHIGQISWTHIKHPNEVLNEGQQIDVKVTKLEKEKKRIGLTMKGLTQNPWEVAATKYTPESTVTGTVSRTTDFGAFVELEPGIEGLIHISELDWKRVRRVTDVVNVGAEVNAKVLEFDGNRRRISLSLKALTEDPRKAEEEALDRAAEEEAEKLKKRRPRNDLKGGIGSPAAGGGLFGNPNDFT